MVCFKTLGKERTLDAGINYFLPVAQSLQNIIWTQIQALQSGSENGKKSIAAVVPSVKSKPMGGNMAGGPVSAVPTSSSSATPPGPAADNAQAALVILLAAQMQAQMGNNHPSLLGNPQMLATLQNLIRQHHGVPGQGPGPGHGPSASAANPGLLAMQAASMNSPSAAHYQFSQNHGNVQDTRKVLHGSGMKNGFMNPNPPQKVSYNFKVTCVTASMLNAVKSQYSVLHFIVVFSFTYSFEIPWSVSHMINEDISLLYSSLLHIFQYYV